MNGQVRVYISGPISGKSMGNLPAFQFAADVIETMFGWEVVNPHNIPPWPHDGPCPPGPRSEDTSAHTSPCHLKGDIAALLECDAIVMLRDWEHSAGARLEMLVAAQCGMPVWFFDNESGALYSTTGAITKEQ